ncbi:MAG: 5'-nucleotidase C-terminal domain-containing protein [Paludibacteraceae bacterium]|nr:5'-nucleotidase C-terminal domain-containing protein [Paludibacteraceae bacterium]
MKRITLLLLAATAIVSCTHQPRRLTAVSEEMKAIDSTLAEDTAYLHALAPVRDALNAQMDIVIGYAPEALTVRQPECTMLNWACDALFYMAAEVYNGPLDFATANIGGMRCNWQAGDITRRSVFELMPFDNRLVILTLQGSDVLELCDEFARQGGQGVSRQLRMQMRGGKAQNVSINGKPVVPDALYYVATSDYLAGGADHFDALTHAIDKHETGLKIRDLYMQYVISRPTVAAKVDGRMTAL